MWQDDDEQQLVAVPDEIVDVFFRLVGKTLPVEHAYPLAAQLKAVAPWIDDAETGIHLVIAGEEGNGWFREQNPDEVIYIARRTRLMLRVPKAQIETATALQNSELDVAGHKIKIGEADTRLLSNHTTIYARHVATDDRDETAFVNNMIETLLVRGIRCRKIMCGKARTIWTPSGPITTRSVMLADLTREDSIAIQQTGIGPHRVLGCGLFVPHKSIS